MYGCVLTISSDVSLFLPVASVTPGCVPVVFQEEETPPGTPSSPSTGLFSLPAAEEGVGGLGHRPQGHQTQADIVANCTNLYFLLQPHSQNRSSDQVTVTDIFTFVGWPQSLSGRGISLSSTT